MGVGSWDELPYRAVKESIDYYGYNYLGTEEANQQNVDSFVEGATGGCNIDPGSSLCDAEAYEPEI